jgi:hypothetical protein
MERKIYEFISTQTNDPIVEWKTCTQSGTEFPIYQSDLKFYDQISPTFDGKKFQIPTPTLSPEERARRRMAWRNERQYYRRTCDASGQSIISIYSPDKPFKVYDQKIWRSDQRNPLDYGREFDFSTSFTENFRALQLEVPRCAVLNGVSENSDYCNHSYHNKNCYMCSAYGNSEDCYYGSGLGFRDKNCIDVDYGIEADNCYDCFKIQNCTACFYCNNCSHCFECWYCNDCNNCSFCF